ncbi:MAG: elongator complex protein 3 [Thermoplasmata archaeon]|jgi:elongator complex protein 3|nr:elongator complex protein 3 [Thermoplasmata archaeon]
MALAEVADAVAAAMRAGRVGDKAQLHTAKRDAAAARGMAAPSDADLAPLLPADLRDSFAAILRTKPSRSASGVAVVAVMSSPAACPHGKCTFCPGGPDVDAPQSYTGFEPSTMRAKQFGYDAYCIVRGRLAQLARNGHAIDKVEVVVQGGTFPARDPAYQDWFVAGIFAGLNDGPGDGAWDTEAAWQALGEAERSARLLALQQANETATCRCVALAIETKPDWCLQPHVDGMLRLGATRIEVGLESLDDEVLRLTHRGHTLAESAQALQVARDAGFKVCAHIMPGLPRPPVDGKLDPDPESDLREFATLWTDPRWRPDMLKIYPTLVVMEGETTLKRQWQRGEFTPYDTAAATRVVAAMKPLVPEYCRIQRIDRDIPTTHVEAGVLNSNLRQLAQQAMAADGKACRCIRCREVRDQAPAGEPVLRRLDYAASGGSEVFLSFETDDRVAGFLRLRRVGPDAHRPEAQAAGGCAFVREVKVYGTATRIGDDPELGAWQHRGLGARLMAEAERIAFTEWGVRRLLVIAGWGVKPYYRRQGYSDCGPYLAKDG